MLERQKEKKQKKHRKIQIRTARENLFHFSAGMKVKTKLRVQSKRRKIKARSKSNIKRGRHDINGTLHDNDNSTLQKQQLKQQSEQFHGEEYEQQQQQPHQMSDHSMMEECNETVVSPSTVTATDNDVSDDEYYAVVESSTLDVDNQLNELHKECRKSQRLLSKLSQTLKGIVKKHRRLERARGKRQVNRELAQALQTSLKL
jgi:hypothetical protein